MIRITLETRMGSVLIRTKGPFGLTREKHLEEQGESVEIELVDEFNITTSGPAVISVEQLEEGESDE